MCGPLGCAVVLDTLRGGRVKQGVRLIWRGEVHGVYGDEGARFYAKQMSIMPRWPESTPKGAEFVMPMAK